MNIIISRWIQRYQDIEYEYEYSENDDDDDDDDYDDISAVDCI